MRISLTKLALLAYKLQLWPSDIVLLSGHSLSVMKTIINGGRVRTNIIHDICQRFNIRPEDILEDE